MISDIKNAGNDLLHIFPHFLILNYLKMPLLFVEVLDFVDENGNEVLQLGSIVKLAEKTIRLILSR